MGNPIDEHADPILAHKISDILVSAENLEELVRPLLAILKTITGLETTFFTQIDLEKNTQTVLYANSSSTLEIPEGLSIDWDNTLCKRALDENTFATHEVATCWGDNEAARQLNIHTYLSEPVFIENHQLFGTLCATSIDKKTLDNIPDYLIKLFAHVIARQIERDHLISLLKLQNLDLARLSLLDPLTGLHNRRGIEKELNHMLNTAQRLGLVVQVVFIDLDHFKAINDAHGHAVGDQFLTQMARHLQHALRESDLIARYGGDEFLVAVLSSTDDTGENAESLRQRIALLTQHRFQLDDLSLDYAGASVGVTTSTPGESNAMALISRADAAMYQQKLMRQTARAT